MIVAGYARVSTEDQATQGYSLDAQSRAITKVCDDRGWQVKRIYVDQGLSAKDMLGRPALLEMLDDAKEGKFQLVLFTSLDRLTRDGKDYQDVRALLLSYGVRMGETSNPDTDFNDPFVKFMMDIKASVAELERRMIGLRTRRGMDEAKKQGKWMGKKPAGYTIDKDSGKLKLNERGVKVLALLQDNPNIRPITVQKELDIDNYKVAYELLDSVKSRPELKTARDPMMSEA